MSGSTPFGRSATRYADQASAGALQAQAEPGHHRRAVRRRRAAHPHRHDRRRDADRAGRARRCRRHDHDRLRHRQEAARRPGPGRRDAGVHGRQDHGAGRHDQAHGHAGRAGRRRRQAGRRRRSRTSRPRGADGAAESGLGAVRRAHEPRRATASTQHRPHRRGRRPGTRPRHRRWVAVACCTVCITWMPITAADLHDQLLHGPGHAEVVLVDGVGHRGRHGRRRHPRPMPLNARATAITTDDEPSCSEASTTMDDAITIERTGHPGDPLADPHGQPAGSRGGEGERQRAEDDEQPHGGGGVAESLLEQHGRQDEPAHVGEVGEQPGWRSAQ